MEILAGTRVPDGKVRYRGRAAQPRALCSIPEMAEQLLGGFLAGAGIARDADETGGIPGKAAGLALHTEGSGKAQLLQQFLAVAAVGAKRIGKGIGPPAGHLLDAVLGFLQIGAHGGKILFSGFILALGGAAAGIPGLVQITGGSRKPHQSLMITRAFHWC